MASTQEDPSRLRELENASGRSITIEDDETRVKYCHQQPQSPLFSFLPREIRDLIWAFATAPIEDQNHKYAENEYYCRPGHRARHKTFTSLLLTCRRAWLEANALPMLQAEQCFWYYRAAPDQRNRDWMAGLTDKNRRDFGVLRLFAQMFAIERLTTQRGWLRRFFLTTPERAGDFQPRVLHVTIRHTDWWNWENEQALELKDRWVQALLDSPDLRSTHTLKLELETLDYKVDQLAPIVERIVKMESKVYETHLINGQREPTHFVLSPVRDIYTWTGPSDFNKQSFAPYRGRTTLNYHVVTLTWHLRFANLPRPHIPTLRRAPRIDAAAASATASSSHHSRNAEEADDDTRDDMPLPPLPREPHYHTNPTRGRKRQRRACANAMIDESEAKAAKRERFVAVGRQSFLWEYQKVRDERRLVTEWNRIRQDARSMKRAAREERFEALRGMMERGEIEALSQAKGGLLRFA